MANEDSVAPEDWMREAILLGREAMAGGNRPFACVLVKDGQVVARSYNRVLEDQDPTSHAELNIIRSFCSENRLTDLSDYAMYTDAEPCAMCSSAIAWANLSMVAFGADRNDGPFDYPRQTDLSCEEVIRRSGRGVKVAPHVLREECAALFKEFSER